MNGITVLHKRPDEISQILVCAARVLGVWWCFGDPRRVLPEPGRIWLGLPVSMGGPQAKWPDGVPGVRGRGQEELNF